MQHRRMLLSGIQQKIASPLIRNAMALYSVQGLQYVIPLITLPWLVRALGTDGYGLLNLAGAFGGYLQVFCDYGFQLSATRTLSQQRQDPAKVSALISAVMAAKVVLATLGLCAAGLTVWTIPSFREHAGLLLLGGFGALAGSFFPSWLFQGMEKMGSMAALSAISRVVQLAFLLLLVHRPEHLALTLWINAFVGVAATLCAWILAWKRFSLRLGIPSFQQTSAVLREGFEIFLSQAGGLLFANTNVLMLGIFATPSAVGLYAIAEKIVRVGIQLGGPIGTALYPRAALLLRQSQSEALTFLRRVLWIGSILFGAVSFGLVLSSSLSVRLICGHASPPIEHLIFILAPLPLTVFIDNILGTQIVLNLGHRRLFMIGPLSAGILAILCQVILVPRFQAVGAALSLLLSELWILLFFATAAWKLTRFPFHDKPQALAKVL